jgi:hypothetical protein
MRRERVIDQKGGLCMGMKKALQITSKEFGSTGNGEERVVKGSCHAVGDLE